MCGGFAGCGVFIAEMECGVLLGVNSDGVYMGDMV